MADLYTYAVIVGAPGRGRVLRVLEAERHDEGRLDAEHGSGRDEGHGPQRVVACGTFDVEVGDIVEVDADGVVQAIVEA